MRRMFYLKPGEMGDHRDLESQPLLGPSSGEVTVIIIIIIISSGEVTVIIIIIITSGEVTFIIVIIDLQSCTVSDHCCHLR